MFCTKCGKQVNDGLKFCTNCGAPMNWNDNERISGSANNKNQKNNKPKKKKSESFPVMQLVSWNYSVI